MIKTVLFISVSFLVSNIAFAQSNQCKQAMGSLQKGLNSSASRTVGASSARTQSASTTRKTSSRGKVRTASNGESTSSGKVQAAGVGSAISGALQAIGQSIKAQSEIESKRLEAEVKRITKLREIDRNLFKQEKSLLDKKRSYESKKRKLKLDLRKAESELKNKHIDIEMQCRKAAREEYLAEKKVVFDRMKDGRYISNNLASASGTKKRRRRRKTYFFKECMNEAEPIRRKLHNNYLYFLDAMRFASKEFDLQVNNIASDVDLYRAQNKLDKDAYQRIYGIQQQDLSNQQSAAQQQATLGVLSQLVSAAGQGEGATQEASAAISSASACMSGGKVGGRPVSPRIHKELSLSLGRTCGQQLIDRCFVSTTANNSRSSASQ